MLYVRFRDKNCEGGLIVTISVRGLAAGDLLNFDGPANQRMAAILPAPS